MSCLTCHNPHEPLRKAATAYAHQVRFLPSCCLTHHPNSRPFLRGMPHAADNCCNESGVHESLDRNLRCGGPQTYACSARRENTAAGPDRYGSIDPIFGSIESVNSTAHFREGACAP